MARPRKFEDLALTTVSIERRMLDEARTRGINISDVLRESLRTRLNFETKIEDREDLTEEELKARERVVEAEKGRKLAELKFKGFPAHYLENVKKTLKTGQLTPEQIVISFGNKVPNLTAKDVRALVEVKR